MKFRNCLLAFALVQAAVLGQSDYYVSSPSAGGIYRGDFVTGASTPFGVGLLIPHYGWFGNDGNFYVPDRGWPAIMKITPTGTVSFAAAGAGIIKPVTVIPSLDKASFVVSDMDANAVYSLGYDGTLVVIHDSASTNGLLDGPDGMAYDDAGNLYVANLGGDTIIKIDPAGQATLFSDSPLIREPGGLALDGAGNLFVANYATSTIARFRLDTAVGEIFAGPDISKLAHPNDLKLSRKGGLLSSARQGAVGRIDALGNITVVFSDPSLGELDGVAVPEDSTLCTGRFTTYGAGTAGTGGIVPEFRAIFSPCTGQTIGLEMRNFLGGAPAIMFVGTGALPPGTVHLKGASLLVDPGGAMFFPISFTMPGVGAGQGNLTMQFVLPDVSGFVGLSLYHQVFARDLGAAGKVSASNGLTETFGS